MAEGKKRLFKRETAYKALVGLCNRAVSVNAGTADLPYPDSIRDIYVFGSYVNSANEKIHDLDIAIVVDEHRDKWQEFSEVYGLSLRYDFISYIFAPQILLKRCLKVSNLISLHIVDSVDFLNEIVLSKANIHIMRNGSIDNAAVKDAEALCHLSQTDRDS